MEKPSDLSKTCKILALRFERFVFGREENSVCTANKHTRSLMNRSPKSDLFPFIQCELKTEYETVRERDHFPYTGVNQSQVLREGIIRKKKRRKQFSDGR